MQEKSKVFCKDHLVLSKDCFSQVVLQQKIHCFHLGRGLGAGSRVFKRQPRGLQGEAAGSESRIPDAKGNAEATRKGRWAPERLLIAYRPL